MCNCRFRHCNSSSHTTLLYDGGLRGGERAKFGFEDFRMIDAVTAVSLSDKYHISIDVVRYIKGYIFYEVLTDKNIRNAVWLWLEDERACRMKFGHISYWNTSRITNMRDLFSGVEFFIRDLSLSETTRMRKIVSRACLFNDDISRWDVSNVTNMIGMFTNLYLFNCNLCQWDVSKVTSMSGMFAEAQSFKGDISGWDVSNVKDMSGMFQGASSFNVDISGWDISDDVDIKFMFARASSFNIDLQRWNISNEKMILAFTPDFKNEIGELLYPMVKEHQPLLAGKITGMLLELSEEKLQQLLVSPEALRSKVHEAVTVLQHHYQIL